MNNAQEYSDSIAADIFELEEMLKETDADWYEELCVLDAEFTVSSRKNLVAVSLIRTIGGPYCVIELRGNGVAVVKTFWGSEKGVASVDAPTLEGLAFDFGEAHLV
jgi:hypothetical protein